MSVCLSSNKLEFFVHNILNLEENDQLLLKELIEKVLHRPEPLDLNSINHEQDLIAATLGEERRQKKERELLGVIDELENENGLLKKKLNEMSEERNCLQKRLQELSDVVENKNSEVKRVLLEKENFQKDMLLKAIIFIENRAE